MDIERIAVRVCDEYKKEILMRANEHEMNVDAGEERPVRNFDRMVRLLEKGGRDGKRLSDKEWEWLREVVSRMATRS